MRNQLLRDADWAGMAHSLEVRVPFVDVAVLSKATAAKAAFPDIHKANLARRIIVHPTEALLARKKTGFSVPMGKWLGLEGSSTQVVFQKWQQIVLCRYLQSVGVSVGETAMGLSPSAPFHHRTTQAA